jgi:hypothetical protein
MERVVATARKKLTMGVIVGNRDFFLIMATSGQQELIHLLQKAGMAAVVLFPDRHGTATLC